MVTVSPAYDDWPLTTAVRHWVIVKGSREQLLKSEEAYVSMYVRGVVVSKFVMSIVVYNWNEASAGDTRLTPDHEQVAKATLMKKGQNKRDFI
jgi:hypothetical protein